MKDEPLDDAFQRIVLEKISENLTLLQHAAEDPILAVHEIRKNIKRVRALLRLFRGAMDHNEFRVLNAAWRDLGWLVSDLRDQAVLLETLDHVFPESIEQIAVQRMQIAVERDAAYTAWLQDRLATDHLADGFAAQQAFWEQAVFSVDVSQMHAGYDRGYRLASKALKRVLKSPESPEEFHAWRKRVKDWWYHHELLHELLGETEEFEGRMQRLDHLSDLLGLAHDAAVFEMYMRDQEGLEPHSARQVDFFRFDQESAALAHGLKLFT